MVLELHSLSPFVPQLADLLKANVDSGASIGFLAPLDPEEASAYWWEVDSLLGNRLLWVFEKHQKILGTIQLDLCTKPNALHRAEIIKLMVDPAHRREGIATALLAQAEAAALQLGRTTLVLDTRQGDPSEKLYLSLGWQITGVVPAYARGGSGLEPCVFMHKLL
jgi:acetyltransferase